VNTLTKSPPAELLPAGNRPEAGGDSEHLDLATCVAAVRLRTPAELGASSWQSSFKGSSDKAQLFVDLHRSNPEAAHRLTAAVTALPEVGTELLGFRLLAELGRGAFGRVYLAQQGDLADRLVVLKISPNVDEESRTLAQLQHTNIVPVYSVHRAGPFQAVCMPYFGSTTLAGVLKEIEGRDSLPESGKALVTTIVERKSTHRERAADCDLIPTVAGRSVQLEAPVAQREDPAAPPSPPVALPSTATAPATLDILQGLSYVEAVLWIGSRLADGLAHAHERGIVHRDLKPANILLTDDGQPMLLDFNLAHDTKLSNPAAVAQVGGTLPFMAPEQIEAYHSETMLLDYRSDIYSLGVILFEMLTGRAPFPSHVGPVKQVLEEMVSDRRKSPPAVCCCNKAVTPAVESIIRHCLEPDPTRRYQSARQLKEDLDRHLANLPLCHAPEPSLRERACKWRRRHPRLASTSSVAVIAVVLIAGLIGMVLVRGQRLADMAARESLSQFLDSKKTVQYLLTARADQPAQLDRGIHDGREALRSLGVLDDASWQDRPGFRRLSTADQAVLRKNAAELLLLMARGVSLQASNQSETSAQQELVGQALEFNLLAESCIGREQASRTLLAQRAELTGQLGRSEEAKKLQARALTTPLRTAADHYLVAVEHAAQGRFQEALPLLVQATDQDPQDYWAWFLRGVCHDHLSQPTEAIACNSTCIALAPESHWAYLNRGLTRLRQQRFQQAAADLDRVLELRPDLVEAYKNRALAREGLKQYAEAIDDLTRALELGDSPTHVYFLRAAVRDHAGDTKGAKKDREEGMRREPADEMDWLARGYARMNIEPRAALEDFDQALKINSRSLAALQNKAHILSKLGRNEEAVKSLDKLVDVYPDFVLARAGRGVLLARLGKREAAHKDALECLARDNLPLTFYQLAGIYALTSKTSRVDRQQAFRLLSVSLQKGVGFDLLETDRDLDPIRECPEFKKLVAAARAIRSTITVTTKK
jgi:serine/threonine protein kinase/tetratricopeptide (TPR) repeat protein